MVNIVTELQNIKENINRVGIAMKTKGIDSTQSMPNWNIFISNIAKLMINPEKNLNIIQNGKLTTRYHEAKSEAKAILGDNHDSLKRLDSSVNLLLEKVLENDAQIKPNMN